MFNLDAIDDHFPIRVDGKASYREGQRGIIEFTLKAFNEGKHIVIIEAPTGSGKSPVGMTLANMVKDSYYLTSSKQLQDQITQDFPDVVELKGRNAYPCTFYDRFGPEMIKRGIWNQAQLDGFKSKSPGCSEGFCKTKTGKAQGGDKFKCLKCFTVAGPNGNKRPSGDLELLPLGMRYSACPYYEQVYKAVSSSKVTMNFSSFLFQTQMTKRFNEPRELLIIDECLHPHTQIQTESGLVPIGKLVDEQMVVRVASFNFQTKQVEYKSIARWLKRDQQLTYKVLVGDCVLYPTADHKIYTPQGKKKLSELKVGDQVYVKHPNCGDISTQSIKSIEPYETTFNYDLEVEDNHNYFAGDILVSNCHNVESQLLDFVSLTINDSHLTQFGIYLPQLDSPAEYAVWFEDAKVGEHIYQVIEQAKENDQFWLEDELSRTLKKYKMFLDHVQNTDAEWVHEYEQTQSGSHKVTLKPVFVHGMAHQLLFKYAKNVVLMSATVLDVDIVCKSLGIKKEHVAAIRLKNRFPVENRPIFLKTVAKMTGGKQNMGAWGPALVGGVNQIVEQYAGKKGIIHTHNFAIQNLLKDRCAKSIKSRFLFQQDFKDKSEMLVEHQRRKDSVIIAPAMHEGVDLNGDLCYDSETELLTEFGWVEFPKFIDGVAVAAYDTNTGLVSFEIPSAITRGHSSQWVEFDTMTNNLVVTANHRMLWRDSQTGSLKETRADEAPNTNKFQFICAGGMLSDGLNLTDDQLRLAAAYQADGCWSGPTDTYMKFSFRRPRKTARLKEILGRLGYDFKEQETKRGDIKILVDKKYFVPLKILGDWDKTWKFENLMKLNIDQRRILLSELSHWDGTQSESSHHDKWVYCSSLPENIDTIQAVAALSNLRSDYNGHRLTYRDTQQAIFVPGEHNYIIRSYQTSMPCYCVTVSTGWVIVRRRGKVSVSGNSRFQIICKIPYPNFFDNEQLARRVEIDRRYLTWLTALKLVQSYGRSVRSDTDFADTYILDESIYKFLKDAAKMLPGWFLEAIREAP